MAKISGDNIDGGGVTAGTMRGDNSNLDPSTGKALPFYLSFGGGVGSMILPLPPKSININLSTRVGIATTRRGNHIDEWGPAPITIDLAGTFGWGLQPSLEGLRTGKESLAFFAHLWETRARRIESGSTDPNTLLITFIDRQDGVLIDCAIPTFTYQRDDTSPNLYRYQMRLMGVKVQQLFLALDSTTIAGALTPNGGSGGKLPPGATPSTPPTDTPGANTPDSVVHAFALNTSAGSGPTLYAYQTPGGGSSLADTAGALYGTPASWATNALVAANSLPDNFGTSTIAPGMPLLYQDPQTIAAAAFPMVVV